MPIVRAQGTGEGIKAFCAGNGPETPDVLGASRPMFATDWAICSAHGVRQVREIRIGYDSLVLANGVGRPTISITRSDLWRAAAKYVPAGGSFVLNPYQSWHDVNPALPDLPIKLLGPASGRGTRDAFAELIMEPACRATEPGRNLDARAAADTCTTIREDGRWVEIADLELALGRLTADPVAFAILPYSYLEQFGTRIQAASVDSVNPSRSTITSGRYPIVRPLLIYIKEAHVASKTGLVDYLAEFLSFCASGNHGYLSDEGLVPMPVSELLTQRAIAAQLQGAARPNY